MDTGSYSLLGLYLHTRLALPARLATHAWGSRRAAT
jgi:hypothetical protein